MAFELEDGEAWLRLSQDEVTFKTGWCHGSIPLDLEPEELGRLADGIVRLAEKGSGSFFWSNDGNEVQMEIVMAKRDETHWSVRLQAAPDYLHELRLVFVGRQADLMKLARSF